MITFSVRLLFHGDLPFFLRSKTPAIERQLQERTSVKDIIEACGVPHTEVDLILVDDQPVDLSRVIGCTGKIDVFSVDSKRLTLFSENRLQVTEISKFVADGHLGKLVRDLRLLGIDVLYDRGADDRQLIETSGNQDRALLTRDRRLLMHSAVRHGYYVRSQNSLKQTIEVLRRFNLGLVLTPFSRCLRCNAQLERAKKREIISQLEPLTKIYYDEFRRCLSCGQIYWAGSHFGKLRKRIETIQSRLANEHSA